MTVSNSQAETVVIGAGPGGYTTAIRAAQLNEDVTLVERDALGGTCLNYGCIPSKALISATDVAHQAAGASKMGVDAEVSLDFSRMRDWKGGVVDQLTGGVEQLCRANGVTLVDGTARFEDEDSVSVVKDDGTTEVIEFENAVIATGSRPIEIPGFPFSGDGIWDSRQALAADEVPNSLVVVGAGYIGMELASVFAKLDADVEIIEMESDILPAYDSGITEPVQKRAESLGIDFTFGYTATDWTPTENGIEVTADPLDGTAGEQVVLTGERLLVAVGREPVTDTLDLENAGIEVDDHGFVPVTDECLTETPNIFAVGDVAGEPMLAHKGSAEGAVAAEVIAGNDSATDYRTVPAAVFTEPEIATAGLTEDEAVAEGYDVVMGEFPFTANGRALTADETAGFVRVIADADSEFLLGGVIVGPEASEMIGEIGLAIEMGATLTDIGRTIHTHPTLSEAIMEAAENAHSKAIHTINR